MTTEDYSEFSACAIREARTGGQIDKAQVFATLAVADRLDRIGDLLTVLAAPPEGALAPTGVTPEMVAMLRECASDVEHAFPPTARTQELANLLAIVGALYDRLAPSE